MLNLISTQNNTFIIGWCAKLLGKVMEWLYVLFDKGFNIQSIGLCIILFTLIIKLLMIPLTVKQQKFSKLSSLMNPELQAIQKKYQGKRDNDSMMKMNEETQAVYQKYGTSPTGSCLQILIQMPVLFSLYYIISGIPAYVPQVKAYFEPVSEAVVADYDYFKCMDKAYDDYVVGKNGKDEYAYIDEMIDSFSKTKKNKNLNMNSDTAENQVIDLLATYSNKKWDNLEKSYESLDSYALELKKLSDDDWEKLKSDFGKSQKDNVDELKKAVENGKVSELFKGNKEVISNEKEKIMDIYEFGPINLSQAPNVMMGIYLLIPILSFLTQLLSIQISMKGNKEQMDNMQDNPMANSMKVMNVVMPLMSAFIAFTVPAGLGFYWILTAVFQTITQIILNAYFKKVDVEDIINKNLEKMKKKKEKLGIYSDVVSSASTQKTRSISSKANVNTKNINNQNVKYKSGSMAEKANMVKSYNEKNNRK